jgi:hypothetical protein
LLDSKIVYEAVQAGLHPSQESISGIIPTDMFFFLGGVKAINYFLVNHPIIDSKSPCFSKSPMIFMIDFLIKTSIYGDYEQKQSHCHF